ncbi:MAG TPA: glycosyltransferase, partial [Telluria sp.]
MKMEAPPKPRARKGAAASSRWRGSVEGVHQGQLYGWAIDAERPDARVVLEICLNDEPIGSLIADVSRTDLVDTFQAAAPAADTCHGFVADLRIDAKESGTISVRVANTDHTLAGSTPWNLAEKPSLAATSSVYSDGALRLHGWAIDSVNEKRPVTVSAYVGSTKVAETVANLTTPAVRSHGADGHAFTLDLPLSLADGRNHTIRIVNEAGVPLNGSPLTVCAYAGGVRALLPEGSDRLMDDVIELYERYVPRSLGFRHYASWKASFAPAQVPPGVPSMSVGLLVVPTGVPVEPTLASIKGQLATRVTAFVQDRATPTFAAQLQAALAAGCDVIACIRAGDTLPEHALCTALEGFRLAGSDIVYTDSEFKGTPWFKPAWNPDYAYSTDYPLELMLVRAALLVGPASPAPAGKRGAAQKTSGAPACTTAASFAWTSLAAAAARNPESIVHVPHVLYHFNSPLGEQEIAERSEACKHAVAIIDPALGITEQPRPAGCWHAARRVSRPLTTAERKTSVSLVIPTRDYAEMLGRCISTIQKHTNWPALEIIVIDNGSVEAKTKTYFRSLAKQGVRVLPMPGPFNFADLNNRAIAQASGDIVGLMNNDIEALHDGWLDEIVGQLLRPNVGAVGAKLLWPNDMVQHGGVLMGVGNAAGHFGNLLADQDWGDHGRNQLVQQVTGVTAACMFMRRADYIGLGGMDGAAFPVAFNDVDLCLKIRAAGKAIVWTPHARLLHAESASRGREDSPQKRTRAQRELNGLRQRWGHVLLRDPAYHPSLNLDPHSNAFGGLALPPRDRAPRTAALEMGTVPAGLSPALAAAPKMQGTVPTGLSPALLPPKPQNRRTTTARAGSPAEPAPKVKRAP